MGNKSGSEVRHRSMNRSSMFTLVLATLTLLSFTIPGPAHATEPLGLNWTSRASLSFGTSEAAVTLGADGRVYVMGGWTSVAINNTARAYNPSTDTWSTLAPLTYATRGAVAVSANNGLIYVIGGLGNSGYLNYNQAYNITSNIWTLKATIPTPVWKAGATLGADGNIYVIAGYYNGSPINSVQIYHPSLDSWSVGAALPDARWALGVVRAPSGLIYAMGGAVGTQVNSTVYEYDPLGDSWRAAGEMPRAKAYFGTTLGADGLIYTFGGSSSYADVFSPFLNTVEAYDPVANQWFNVGSLSSGRKNLSAVTAPSGDMYVVGGYNGTDLTTNEQASLIVPNQPPVASITSITATPVTQGTSITFTGTGTSTTGTIVGYRWRSSISGVLSSQATFSTTTMAVGTHTIYFSVEDNSGVWSPETTAVVTVNPTPTPITSDPTYQAVQTTMLVADITLAAAIAAAIVSLYTLITRPKSKLTTGPTGA